MGRHAPCRPTIWCPLDSLAHSWAALPVWLIGPSLLVKVCEKHTEARIWI